MLIKFGCWEEEAVLCGPDRNIPDTGIQLGNDSRLRIYTRLVFIYEYIIRCDNHLGYCLSQHIKHHDTSWHIMTQLKGLHCSEVIQFPALKMKRLWEMEHYNDKLFLRFSLPDQSITNERQWTQTNIWSLINACCVHQRHTTWIHNMCFSLQMKCIILLLMF